MTALLAGHDSDASCPAGTVIVDRFAAEGYDDWLACEDLNHPGGGLTLVGGAEAKTVHLPKSYEPYSKGTDAEYYLGLGKSAATNAKWDMLGHHILSGCRDKTTTTGLCEPTWQRVEQAVPRMRYSRGNPKASGNRFMCSPYSPESGVRTFTGSRSASVDASFSDHADDCTDNGFPRPQGYVMNLTAISRDEPPIHDFLRYVNFTGMAEGLVGGDRGYPNLIFYFPILPQDFAAFGGSRYWTMIASPVPDMQGGREQSTWFRFQQIRCAGTHRRPPCERIGDAQYYDTYWYSNSPITTRWIRPELRANASGFYSNLLAVKRFWDATLIAEGMMRLRLPEGTSTNGTWLSQQAIFSIVRSMISRDDTWHPRYGILPGYGVSLQDGFQDTFTSTATAALEFGAWPYAKGVIDNWLRFYMRDDGMVTYRAEELAQSGRMLTIFMLYHSYTGDDALLLRHFGKIRAHARWLLYRYETALSMHPNVSDPRHGIIAGGDEGDTFVGYYETYGTQPLPHKYSTHANVYRGFMDVGSMWNALALNTGRKDLAAHAAELLDAAPRMREHLQASLQMTIWPTGNPRAPRCVPTGADPPAAAADPPIGCLGDFRGFPELMYAGVLSSRQAEDLYLHLTYGNDTRLVTRPMTLGCTGYNNKCSTYVAYGMGYGLLVHDMVERFLLHYFGMSAHTYTRGTWTTPEATDPNREVGSTDYVAAGVHTAPTYLKWMLVFEEPDARTVWLAKALPREWLAPSADTVLVEDAPTRYGRVSFVMSAAVADSQYSVRANVTLPAPYFCANGPPGGLRLRLRAPVALAGRMESVTVGGSAWDAFDPKSETVDFTSAVLRSSSTASSLQARMQTIVARWARRRSP